MVVFWIERIVTFIVVEGIGFCLLYFTDGIIKFVGRIGFAEKVFGAAGTYTFLRLLGGLVMFGGLLFVTGVGQKALDGIFGELAPEQDILGLINLFQE